MFNPEKMYLVESDEYNYKRNSLLINTIRETFNFVNNVEEADCIVVIGGDGSLLHTIQKYKDLKIPFLGIQGGTIGYYMNEINCSDSNVCSIDLKKEFSASFDIIKFPTLSFEAHSIDDRIIKNTAFNDIWVERAKKDSLKMTCEINEYEFLNEIIGDGMLFSTPAGSTAYAKNLGASICPHSLKAFQMVPIACSIQKQRLRAMPLNFTDKFILHIKDTDYRTPELYYDGIEVKNFTPKKIIITQGDETIKLAFFSKTDFIKRSFSWQFSG